jgi:putative intracellular protease/amidase
MFDLAVDPESHSLIKEFYEKGKVVSAVCHGPAALVNVKLSDGSYLVAGQEVTGKCRGLSGVGKDKLGC